jgi:tRNA(Ile2) C34 agmatinyltransferase TiaS
LGERAFEGCLSLENVEMTEELSKDSALLEKALRGTPFFLEYMNELSRAQWRKQGRCVYCGGQLNFFGKTCKSCGRKN